MEKQPFLIRPSRTALHVVKLYATDARALRIATTMSRKKEQREKNLFLFHKNKAERFLRYYYGGWDGMPKSKELVSPLTLKLLRKEKEHA